MTFHRLGILVIGHGTRDVLGQAQMRLLACQTAGLMAPLPTELGFLELAEPTIEKGVRRLAQLGIQHLVSVPVLLFRAGHADHDIPQAVAAAASAAGIEVAGQTPPLEHQPTIVDLSAERFHEALKEGKCSHVPFSKIALALIARGSSSKAAAEAMESFAHLRQAVAPVGAYRVGYVAVRQPNVEETLDWLASTDADVLVVQPHLLFEGEVYHSLQAATAARQAVDGRRWLVAKPLGSANDDFDDQRLASVLAELVCFLVTKL